MTKTHGIKLTLAATLTAIAMGSLAACGSGGNGGSAASHTIKAGQTLVIADETQPLSGLDPIMAQAFDAKRMVAQFYEGLLRLGADGKTIEPALASKWTVKSPTEYDFTLRDGLTFHDGTPVTADDVVYSLERIVDPKQNSPYGPLYSIKSVTAPDASHVVVQLKEPQVSLLRLLAQPWSGGIVSKKWMTSHTADQVKTAENGTGPFEIDSFTEGSSIKTSAFKNYWDGVPAIANIEYRVMPDESTRVRALQSGAIQMAQLRLPTNIAQLKKSGFNIGDPYFIGSYWLAMDDSKGALADVRVRRALSMGIDRRQLIDIGAQGNAVLAGLVPPGDPYGTQADESTPYYKYDPTEAKALLQEAGQSNLTLTLAVRADSPEKIATAQLVKEQLAKIGVTLKIQQVEWTRLVSAITSGEWNADMVQLSAALNADPSQYLDLWYGKNSPANKAHDEKLESMLKDAVSQDLSDDERTAKYAAINTYIADQAYMLVPYASPQAQDVWAPGMTFQSDPSSTRMGLRDATIK